MNFRNCIIIFTSNVGSSSILDVDSASDDTGAGRDAIVQSKVMEALRAQFRPEFLNRIDEFVTFKSLAVEQLKPIVSLERRAPPFPLTSSSPLSCYLCMTSTTVI